MISDLKSHTYKKGLIQPPMNTFENNQLVSWMNDRLPEYLWLGLILMSYKRMNGIEKAGKILKEISQINASMIKPKLSVILSLSDSEQEEIYKIIRNEVNPKILAPLTVIYRNSNHSTFNKNFNMPEIPISKRINILGKAIKLYYDHQSYEATDLRFVVLSMMIFQNKLHVHEGSGIPEAFTNYPYTNHDDEKMKMYHPSIRATEMMDIGNLPNKTFINNFWKEIGMKTDCALTIIDFNNKDEKMDYKKYILEIQKKLNYLLFEFKEKSLMDDKFDVIIGTITYTLKIFNDVVEKDLDDSILGRHAYRTILEAYINIKYLLKIESEKPNIWEEYKLYGIGKYKLPLLKERENANTSNDTHFVEPLVDVLINEILWEEFIDIDVRYFDKKKVKEKFEEVGEKHLYEVLYEYDNNFIHGFWGAVRESSMLHCNNAAHKYHSVPDINFEQKMPSVNDDIYKIIEKFSRLIDEEY
ncbi:MAG: DUF5677 domain-containing protein [Sulfurovum sp.]|nr:DUF5677 domain-containing protein [Sulfurovum sp.]